MLGRACSRRCGPAQCYTQRADNAGGWVHSTAPRLPGLSVPRCFVPCIPRQSCGAGGSYIFLVHMHCNLLIACMIVYQTYKSE